MVLSSALDSDSGERSFNNSSGIQSGSCLELNLVGIRLFRGSQAREGWDGSRGFD